MSDYNIDDPYITMQRFGECIGIITFERKHNRLQGDLVMISSPIQSTTGYAEEQFPLAIGLLPKRALFRY